jgi:uncharacterized integral membrane protein
MATAKKTTAKKTSTSKKAPVKKASVKTTPKIRSFHVSPDIPSFGTFKITRQTVYWVIIVSVIIFMQLWILALQIQTSMQIESELSSLQTNN